MAAFGQLTPHVFINNVTASVASSWYPVEYNHGGMQSERSISGTKVSAANSEVVVEVRTLIMSARSTVADVLSTATSWGGAVTNFSAIIVGPYTHIRARRVGTSAAATVVGVL